MLLKKNTGFREWFPGAGAVITEFNCLFLFRDEFPITDIHGDGWQYAVKALKKTFPGLPACPYVMTGATDARFYQQICRNVIRFAPVVYGPEQMKGMHGLNENISVDCLPGAVDFYKNLIKG